MTAVLDRLERAGYARRVRDDKDGRQVIVELTPLARRADLGPLGQEALEEHARMSVEQLLVMEFFERGREVNERHMYGTSLARPSIGLRSSCASQYRTDSR